MSIREDFAQLMVDDTSKDTTFDDLDSLGSKLALVLKGDKNAYDTDEINLYGGSPLGLVTAMGNRYLKENGYDTLEDKVDKYLTGAKQGYEELGRAELGAAENAPDLFRERTDIDETDLSDYMSEEHQQSDKYKEAEEWWDKAQYNLNHETYKPIAEVASLFGTGGMMALAPFILEDMGKAIDDKDYVGFAKNAAFFATPALSHASGAMTRYAGSALGVAMLASGAKDVTKEVNDENFQGYAKEDPLGAMGTLASHALPILLPVFESARACRKDYLKFKEKLSDAEAKTKMQAETDLQIQRQAFAEGRQYADKKGNYFEQRAKANKAKVKEEQPTPAETKRATEQVADNLQRDMNDNVYWDKIGKKIRQDVEHPYESWFGKAVDVVDSNIKGVVSIKSIFKYANDNFTNARTGRIDAPNANGTYDPKTGAIRVEKHNFFYTLSHEIGHYIDMELLPLKGADKELAQGADNHWGKGVIDPANKRAEGIAEFYQTYALNPKVAEQHYPTYSKMVKNALAKNPELAEKWDTYCNMVRRYYKSTPEEIASASMSYANEAKPKTVWGSVKDSLSRLRHDFQDETSTVADTLSNFYEKINHKVDFDKDPVTLLKQCSNSIGSQVDIMLGFYKAQTGDIMGGFETALGLPANTLRRTTMKDVHGKMTELSKNANVINYLNNTKLKAEGETSVYKATNEYLLAKHTLEVLDEGNTRRLDKLSKIQDTLEKKIIDIDNEINSINQTPNLTQQQHDRLKALAQRRQDTFNKYKVALDESTSIQNGTYDYTDSPLTRKQAQEIIKNAPKEFEEVSKLVQDYNYNMLVLGTHFGLLDPKVAQKFLKTYKDYVPMKRDFSLEKLGEDAPLGNGNGYVSVDSMYHSLTEGGSTRTILDPLGQLEVMTQQLISRGNKNLVAQSFADLADLPHSSELIERVKGSSSSAENVVSIWRNGKRESYQVHNEAVLEALNLDKSSAFLAKNLFEGYLSWAANTLRRYTTSTPPFMIWNAIRDSLTAATTTKNVGSTDFLKANCFYFFCNGMFKQIYGDAKTKAEFAASGTKYATRWHDTMKLTEERISASSIKPKSLREQTSSKWEKLKEAYNSVGEMIENAPRFTEFELARKNGKSILESASDARNITVDFTTHGAKTKSVNGYVAFMNAAIQGNAKIFRDITQRPQEVIPRALIHLTIPSMYLWAINKDKDWYKSIPFDEKMKNWHWETPSGTIMRIPKPELLGYMFASVPERLLDISNGDDRGEALKDTQSFLRDTVMVNGIPTGILPIFEWWANKSFYRGRPIVDRRNEEKEYKDQHNVYTSEVAKMTSKAMTSIPLGIGDTIGETPLASPMLIDNAFRDITGSMGAFFLNTVDAGAEMAGMRKKTPSRYWTEYTRFTYTPNGLKTRESEEFYKRYDKLKRQNKSTGVKSNLYKSVQQDYDKIKQLRQKYNKALDSGKLDSKQLRVEYDNYAKQANKIMRASLSKNFNYKYFNNVE